MKHSNDMHGFVSVGEEIPDILLDIRYYSSFNFIGERIDGYEEQEMVILSSILTWEILWPEEPGRLQSIGSQNF